MRGLALLAAEGAAHAAAFAGHLRIGNAEHVGDEMLHLGGMLGGDNERSSRHALPGSAMLDLALEIEMLLAADAEGLS